MELVEFRMQVSEEKDREYAMQFRRVSLRPMYCRTSFLEDDWIVRMAEVMIFLVVDCIVSWMSEGVVESMALLRFMREDASDQR